MEENPWREIHFMHTSFCAWEPPQLLGEKRKNTRKGHYAGEKLLELFWCGLSSVGACVCDVSGTRYGTEKVLRRSGSLSMWVFIEQRGWLRQRVKIMFA